MHYPNTSPRPRRGTPNTGPPVPSEPATSYQFLPTLLHQKMETCLNATCSNETTLQFLLRNRPWEEEELWGGLRRWHIMALSALGVLIIVCFLCRVFNCRVPRTKQEIEANFARRKLTDKFWKELRTIRNSDMDEMDLMKALERLQMDLYNEETSLAQSDAFSALSFTPSGTTYRKASEVNLGVSASELDLQRAAADRGVKERVTSLIASALDKLRS